MYSQYKYYQEGGTSSVTGPSQVTSHSTTNLRWDGTQWVSFSPATRSTPTAFLMERQNFSTSNKLGITARFPPPQTKLPPTPSHLNAVDVSSLSLEQLVQHYSHIYHHYATEVSSCNGSTIGGKKEWAEYHSDLSARAAHHYNDLLSKQPADAKALKTQSNPTAFSQPKVQIVSKVQSFQTKENQNQTEEKQQRRDVIPSDSFRRYVKRNLKCCSTETQRKAIKELISIAKERAEKRGDFYERDWDQEETLPMPGGSHLSTFYSESPSSNTLQVNPKVTRATSSSWDNIPDSKPKRVFNHTLVNVESNSPKHEKYHDSYQDSKGKGMKSNEQKATRNDWYGSENTNTNVSPVGEASMPFQPKPLKKKTRKRYRKVLEHHKQQNGAAESEPSGLEEKKEDQDDCNPNYQHQKKARSEWDQSSPPAPTQSRGDDSFKSPSSSKANSQLHYHKGNEENRAFNMDLSIQKKVNEIQQQKKTLDEWYGGGDTGAAVISFKPKQKKKKKKKRNIHIKRRALGNNTTKKENPTNLYASPVNVVTMLPRTSRTNLAHEEEFNNKRNYQLKQKNHTWEDQEYVSFDKQCMGQSSAKPRTPDWHNSKQQQEEKLMDLSVLRCDDRTPKDDLEHCRRGTNASSHSSHSISPSFNSTGIIEEACSPQFLQEKKSSIRKQKATKFNGGFKRSKSVLASRASRFSIANATSCELHLEYSQGVDRYMGKSVIGGVRTGFRDDNKRRGDKITYTEEDYETMTVKGICMNLEKDYLRLTSPPQAEQVRPQPILEKHLADLKEKWHLYRTIMYSGQQSNLSYSWFCSQLKAIRQDLTVQRIANAFAVGVYETHATMALQENDMNEYNQSQTQLIELYQLISQNMSKPGDNLQPTGLENQNEFIAYRIIYYVFLTCNQKYDGGSSDLLKIMISLTIEQRKDIYIAHALNVRVAVAESDYHVFFRLQDTCPNYGAYLMDTLLPQVRTVGLKHIIKAYRPSVSISFILKELGFSIDADDIEEGKVWLVNCGCKLSSDGTAILTRESVLNESFLAGIKSSSLI